MLLKIQREIYLVKVMTLFNQHKKRTKHLGSYDEELVKTKLTEILVTENVE
jgi:hypothetical protein